MTFFRKLSDAVYAVERILAILLVAFMVTAIVLGVLFRYFFSSPLTWSDEFALFSLVWVTFIGGSMSIKTKKASSLAFIMERIPQGIAKACITFGTLAAFSFCVFTFSLSIKWLTTPTILLQKSSAVGLPMIIPYIAIPLGFLFMAIHLLDILISTFQYQKREGL